MEKINTVFIETGTHNCENAEHKTVQYSEVHTIDINQKRSENCGKLVHAHTGSSPEVLRAMLTDATRPADFYLDAHADIIPGKTPDGYDRAAPGSSVLRGKTSMDELMPLLPELREISEFNRRVPGNYVCIDDLRCWDRNASSHKAKCPATKLWHEAGISTENIIKTVGDQLKEHRIAGDRLCLTLV